MLPTITRPGRSAVLVLLLVAAAACVAQSFGRFTYGVVLPAVRDELLSSNTTAGLLGTANVGAYLIGTAIVATLSARLPLVRLIAIGLVLSTTGLLLASWAAHGAVMAVALVVMGLGGAAIWIPSPRVASSVLAPSQRGLATGLIGVGIGVGIVFAGRLAEVLRDDGDDGWWRRVYRVEAVLAVIVLVATVALLRRTTARTDGPPAMDAAPAARTGGGFIGFDALRQVPGWKALTGLYAAFGFMYLLVLAFLVARLEDDAGFDAGEASAMFAATGVAAIFGGILLGPLSDRIGRRATMIGAFIGFGASTLAILVGRQPWVLIGSVGVGLMFSGLPTAIAAYVVDTTDATTYGPAYSMATLAFGVAQAAAPQVGGLVADAAGSFTPVFLLSAGCAALGAVLSWQLPRDVSGGGPRAFVTQRA